QPVPLEGSNAIAILFRVNNNTVEKIRGFSLACPLDAGGLPFIWLTGVPAQSSLAYLEKFATSSAGDLAGSAIFAIAQHSDPAADTLLARLVRPSEPERTREQVAFWLGASRGAPGVAALKQILASDPSDRVRDKAVFALSISKQPAALDDLIHAANSDASSHVRSQALFWLAQKAGKRASETITNAIRNDPDTAVKKKAVFALSQLPKDEGVPKLIKVAQTQRNPEVRKQAFFWLGQSQDPRALAFIEQVLTK
ncbi:MAG: HEAT repeat domain-containing protein, partial [Acidobacteriaceae bacterium]|nr:HEAT repeat domain-containing protein [Acidobacteriaceae bacterium]